MLRHIPRNNFADTRRENGYLLPFSVDTTCPICKRTVNFGLTWNQQKNHFVEYSNSHCPSCKSKVKFIYLSQHNEKANTYSGELFITPPGDTRLPLEGINEIEKLPDNIKNAYFSAIEVLNAQVWTASAVMCRRVLEGITKSVVTDDL